MGYLGILKGCLDILNLTILVPNGQGHLQSVTFGLLAITGSF